MRTSAPRRAFAALVLFAAAACGAAPAPADPPVASPWGTFDEEHARRFAHLAIASVVREFPNKPMHVHVGPESAQSPRALHPSFYGSFDWHSAVHGHWLLVRLRRAFPDAAFAAEARAILEEHFAPERIAAEAAYFEPSSNRSYERMYGWAWLFRLVAELQAAAADGDADAARWREQLRPLETILIERTRDYLPRLTYPIRTGVHPDTGFALAQILDYARAVGDAQTEALVLTRARAWYGADAAWNFAFEPSGEDFFSSGLNACDLMRRVLAPAEFARWLDRFWPGLARGELGPLASPATVSDVTDGRIVHLAGLNLSRAWTMRGIAAALPAGDARRARLEALAAEHARAGLDYVFSGHYEGEHWLASFAVYLLTGTGL
jgi:hypothetical protein